MNETKFAKGKLGIEIIGFFTLVATIVIYFNLIDSKVSVTQESQKNDHETLVRILDNQYLMLSEVGIIKTDIKLLQFIHKDIKYRQSAKPLVFLPKDTSIYLGFNPSSYYRTIW